MIDLRPEIKRLKQEMNAVVLAHNYQPTEVQEVAEFVGDSLYLSQVAARTEAEVIVFCGVRFMAETAKLLSPEKMVLLPAADAGCNLADAIAAEDVRRLKQAHPGAPVVCYINSTAAVKAESDICCTSGNAVRVVASLAAATAIFVPDVNLGRYVAGQAPDKKLVLWQSACDVHARLTPEDVSAARRAYPQAKILVHPECPEEVIAAADFTGSTAQIITRAGALPERELVIGTEEGILYKLAEAYPDRRFHLLRPGLCCPDMKKTGLATVYEALRDKKHQIAIDGEIAGRARVSLERMLTLA